MGKKIAALVTDMVEEIEFTDPAEKMRKAGHTVSIVNAEAGKEIKGKNGQNFTVDKGLDEVSPEDFDALLIPGGFSPDLLRINPYHARFAKHFIAEGKPVFAICHGPQFLIDTDLLEGKRVTSFISVRKDLINAGAQFVNEEVVVDQQLVTSRTPDDLPAFNREALKLLNN